MRFRASYIFVGIALFAITETFFIKEQLSVCTRMSEVYEQSIQAVIGRSSSFETKGH